jgi:hypothetical protein
VITKDSKLKDLLKILVKTGACEPGISIFDRMINRSAATTVDEALKKFGSGEVGFEDRWAKILIQKAGKELDPSIRKRIMTRIKPEHAKSLLEEDFFTDEEREMLTIKSKKPVKAE